MNLATIILILICGGITVFLAAMNWLMQDIVKVLIGLGIIGSLAEINWLIRDILKVLKENQAQNEKMK